jgi:isoleucyl-tRNA synthetase
MEQARNTKMIGSSLDAKVLLFVTDSAWKSQLKDLNKAESLAGNRVDELGYLFLSSQVDLLDSPENIQSVEFKSESETLTVGIIKADGHKCDRCWNYSESVGTFKDDPTICDRCDAALKGEF